MLTWAIVFFVIAIVAALLGFGGIAGLSWQIGVVLAVIFVILAIVFMVMGRRPPV
jgi:uncharacterized membrane protein YtjA (UPF0391 family)